MSSPTRRTMPPRAVVVTRPTDLEQLLLRHGTRAQARFLRTHPCADDGSGSSLSAAALVACDSRQRPPHIIASAVDGKATSCHAFMVFDEPRTFPAKDRGRFEKHICRVIRPFNAGAAVRETSAGPSFAWFTHLLSLERGFDKGDDDERLVECQQAARNGSLLPYGWRLFGVLESRRNCHAAAAECFEKAQTGSSDVSLDRFLTGYARLRADRAEGAFRCFQDIIAARDPNAPDARKPIVVPDFMQMLEQYAQGDVDMPRAEAQRIMSESMETSQITAAHVQLALGDALWMLGRHNEALVAYQQSEPGSWYAVAERARLLDHLGRGAEALAALASIPDEAYAELELVAPIQAALVLESQGLDAAVELAQQRGLIDATLESNPRLRPLLSHPTVREIVAPDLSWLSAYPSLAVLRDDARLRAAGVRFVDEKAGRAAGQSLQQRYEGHKWWLGVLWSDALFSVCGEAAKGKTLVAHGTSPTADILRLENLPVEIYADLDHPETLYLLANDRFPAALFIDVPARVEDLERALAAFVVSARIPCLQLTGHKRAYLGYLPDLAIPNPYTGQLEAASPLAIDRHVTFSPALCPSKWGSEFLDDPWPEIPPQPNMLLKVNELSKENRQQAEGGVCTFTRLTRCSRSQVGFELHDLVYVVDVRYRPSPFEDVIARFNAALGTHFPLDFPPDVVAALHGFDFIDETELKAQLEGKTPEAIGPHLAAIAAVGHNDLRTLDFLRPFAHHASATVRGAVYDLAASYNWLPLLGEFVDEEDPALRAYIGRAQRGGFAPPRYDDLGEPVGLMERLEGGSR